MYRTDECVAVAVTNLIGKNNTHKYKNWERKRYKIMSNKNWRFETKQLHVGQEQADPVTDSRAVPIYASTSFVFHNSQHA